jgi:hypothetical protein
MFEWSIEGQSAKIGEWNRFTEGSREEQRKGEGREGEMGREPAFGTDDFHFLAGFSWHAYLNLLIFFLQG